MADRDTLPKSIKPEHYAISLHDIALGAPWTYQGTVRIDGAILALTENIVLNTHQLKITSAELFTEQSKTEHSMKHDSISHDEKRQQATITFNGNLPTSPRASLDIKFEGTMNNAMRGFYRSKYKPAVSPAKSVPKDEEHHYMFSTQFESCDARTAFPCFDEPNMKVSFDFEIEIPNDQVALSNMPVKETKKGSKEDLQVVSFERTPVMSTYLLAWAFGDFEYVEDFTQRTYKGQNIPVRVYTTRGLKEQGRYALEHAHKIVDFYSDVFQIEYPLPKADLLAVHEFSHGAMENWGLVTYRTTAVLFEEGKSDEKYRNRVAYVVAHELAHQWFGNLVTMDWWSELWLNEGFATWVGWFAIDHLHPEWDVWAQFITESMQTAFTLDSLRTSHPIEVPVKDALEVEQIFDAISYCKGSAVIRMLSAHLSAETFLKGVADYLKAHEYGNATTDDLWAALSKASGQDVKSFIDPWIRKIGFPVVKIAEEPGQIGVQQRRFLSTGDVKSQDDQTTWWIPLRLSKGSSQSGQDVAALTTKETTLRSVDENHYKVNEDQTGFYRTDYPPARLEKLGAGRDRLSIQDKIGLVADAAALAGSGDATTTGLLSFVEGFQSETNYLVWSQILSSLGHIRSVFADNEKVSKGLKEFVIRLVTPQTKQLGWDFKPDEDYLTSQLRALLTASAGLAGQHDVVTEAQKRFKDYMGKDHVAIHPNLRSAVWRIAVTFDSSNDAYEKVKNEFLTTSSIDGKEIALQSMGRVQTPELGRDYFNFLFSDRVPIQDVHSGGVSLAANAKTRGTQWECIKANWKHVNDKISGNSVVLDRYLRISLNKFASKDIQKDIKSFFADKDTKGYDRSLGIVADTIAGNADYKERDEKLVLEWLEARKYV